MDKQLSFSVTSYNGYQEELRDILDENRYHKHTLQYLDWRYIAEESPYPPLIFWLRLPSSQAVGVASLISRAYWVNDHESWIWVLGDISLNTELRGKGIGRKLFHFMNSYIDKNLSNYAFVLPGVAAQKSLSATGWSQPYSISCLVWVIDPVAKTFPNIKNSISVQAIRVCLRRLASMWLSLHTSSDDFRLVVASSFGECFNELWQSLDKRNLIIRNRNSTSLNWRFEQNPRKAFKIYRLLYLNKMIGYIVCCIDRNGICQIVDLLAINVKYIRPMVALFLKEMCEKGDVQIVRIKFNEDCLYGKELKKLGFIKRSEKDVFQVYEPKQNEGISLCKWFVTVTDKDT